MSGRGYDAVKRAIDIVGAVLLGLVLLPVILLVASVVAVGTGRPVIFRQRRPGRHGRPFVLVKFRTMTAADGRPDPAHDAERLTAVGRVLRATSLDELPTLWNVLRGDMSLVGPRPLLMSYLDRYTPRQMRRHEVRPGVTGLAQVSGRNALSWGRRLDLDVWYVDNRSLALDLRILLTTVSTVLRRHGITAEGCATAPEFRGTPTETPVRDGVG